MTQGYTGEVRYDEENFYFHGWLSFHPNGGMKLTARPPGNSPAGSRHMKIEYSIPKAVFATPELSCFVQIDKPKEAENFHAHARAASEALSAVFGAEVKVTVHDPE